MMFSSMIGLVLASWAIDGRVATEEMDRISLQEQEEWSELQIDLMDREMQVTLDYFTERTGSRELASVIIEAADMYDIPRTLALALAYKESSFDPHQVSANSKSVDRGLFQLNSLSFPDMSDEEVFNPRINAQTGMSYLRYCWNRGGNATVALAMYNAGPTRVEELGTPVFTMNYIHKIYQFKDSYDRELERRMLFDPQSLRDSEKTVKKVSTIVDQRLDIN